MTSNRVENHHAIDDVIEFEQEKNGLVFINITTANAVARISLHGGQVLSFKPAGQDDLLYVSPKAYYEETKAIKGGCPICWPCFSQSNEYPGLPFHGFARNQNWQVKNTEIDELHAVTVTLILTDSDKSQSLWPYQFELEQKICISDSLSIELITTNTGAESFKITQAIHTYFKVSDISAVRITGLDKKMYLDKVEGFATRTQQGDITFDHEVDRIYLQTDHDQSINDNVLQREITINSENSQTTVVWNPWQEISQVSADLADDSYRHFVCVETANTADEIIDVEPGQSISLKANYNIESLTE